MKNKFFALIAIISLVALLAGQPMTGYTRAAENISAYKDAILAPDGVLYAVPELIYYRFDNSGGTSVPNQASAPVGTNPAPVNGHTIGSTGQFGNALVGVGGSSATNYVNTGWALNLGTGSWTISFWIHNIPASCYPTPCYLFGDSSAGDAFRSYLGGASGQGNLRLIGGGLYTVTVIGAYASTPAVLHFVYDAAVPEIRAYLNGTLVNTSPQPALNITGTAPFKIGAYGSGTNTSFGTGALLDEFRLYNRALSTKEVAATWNNPLPVPAIDSYLPLVVR